MVLPEAEVLSTWPSVITVWTCVLKWKGPSIWALILKPETPRSHMFQSSGVRPQNDQGNQLLWKAAQQDAHNLQEMWNGMQPFSIVRSTKKLLLRLPSTSRRRLVPLVDSLQLRSGDTTGLSRWLLECFICRRTWILQKNIKVKYKSYGKEKKK